MARKLAPTPRSFSHVSFYAPDVRRAATFFLQNCGLGLPRGEPDQNAAFLSTGGNHHEVEIFASDVEVVSHIGIEYETEADLLATANLLADAGVVILKRSVVPNLIRSVFCDDIEGNGLHLFANLSSDWTTWRRGEAKSEEWTPNAVGVGKTASMSLNSIDVVRERGAHRVAVRFVGGVLFGRDPSALSTFYSELLGFTAGQPDGNGDIMILRGQREESALEIRPAKDKLGLAELCFLIEGNQDALLKFGPAGVSIRLSPVVNRYD